MVFLFLPSPLHHSILLSPSSEGVLPSSIPPNLNNNPINPISVSGSLGALDHANSVEISLHHYLFLSRSTKKSFTAASNRPPSEGVLPSSIPPNLNNNPINPISVSGSLGALDRANSVEISPPSLIHVDVNK